MMMILTQKIVNNIVLLKTYSTNMKYITSAKTQKAPKLRNSLKDTITFHGNNRRNCGTNPRQSAKKPSDLKVYNFIKQQHYVRTI